MPLSLTNAMVMYVPCLAYVTCSPLLFLFYTIYCINFLIRAVSPFIQDLDLTKPGVQKPPIRPEFKVTTKEVLSQADFRVSTYVRVFPL